MKDFLHNLWLWKCGYAEKIGSTTYSTSLWDTEWSRDFEALMRFRMVMGSLRYGKLQHGKKSRKNRIANAIKRLHQYQVTGNQECLVDVANLCMCEFVEPYNRNAHFISIDDGEHV